MGCPVEEQGTQAFKWVCLAPAQPSQWNSLEVFPGRGGLKQLVELGLPKSTHVDGRLGFFLPS